MLTSPAEMTRRVRGRVTGRLHSLPILALHVHTACNCRCVMCDIWRANADKREIGLDELAQHVDAIRALRVRRVMLTGGEPLLHTNLWKLCDVLKKHGIRLTLVTTGLLLETHTRDVAHAIDQVVVSLDGSPPVHNTIRRVPNGFERVARGIRALRAQPSRPKLLARSVVQKGNFDALAETVENIRDAGVDHLSFLAADVSSPAFNRPTPWDEARRAEVGLSQDDLPRFAESIRHARSRCAEAFREGFVVGGAAGLWRLYEYYRALLSEGAYPRVHCSAPWVSAVLEPGGVLRPCFFHPAYASTGKSLDATLNSVAAIRFRRELDVGTNDTCQRCVCSLVLPPTREA